jgi:hypothetical protein
VTLEVFEDVRLQVSPAACIHQLKQGGERKVVVNGVIARDQFFKSLKQVFQTQVSAYTFVEGMFVQDHAEKRKI